MIKIILRNINFWKKKIVVKILLVLVECKYILNDVIIVS